MAGWIQRTARRLKYADVVDWMFALLFFVLGLFIALILFVPVHDHDPCIPILPACTETE